MNSRSTGGGFGDMTVLAAAGTLNLALMASPAHAQTIGLSHTRIDTDLKGE
jgi:hypothetical protein